MVSVFDGNSFGGVNNIRTFIVLCQIDNAILFVIGAFCFSFTLLIFIHELLHGFAFLLLGFKKISFGGDIRKFVFYAQADQQVLSRHEFYFLALFPLVTIKAVTIAAILVTIFMHSPWLWFWMVVMAVSYTHLTLPTK